MELTVQVCNLAGDYGKGRIIYYCGGGELTVALPVCNEKDDHCK